MSRPIRFSVHRNPKNDPKAQDTYHVRHEVDWTINRQGIINHLEKHHHLSSVMTAPVLSELPDVIVEYLLQNTNVHIEGLGTFYLKLGFRPHVDAPKDEKPTFSDPNKITGNEVEIEGLGFKPDKDFQKLLFERGHYFVNVNSKGQVGRSTTYTEEEMQKMIVDYFENHVFLTRRIMMARFLLTSYMAQKWLNYFCEKPSPLLRGRRTGSTFIYHLHKSEGRDYPDL